MLSTLCRSRPVLPAGVSGRTAQISRTDGGGWHMLTEEIEITPEMIKAGADVIRREVWIQTGAPYDENAVLDARSIASDVYLAMDRLQLHSAREK